MFQQKSSKALFVWCNHFSWNGFIRLYYLYAGVTCIFKITISTLHDSTVDARYASMQDFNLKKMLFCRVKYFLNSPFCFSFGFLRPALSSLFGAAFLVNSWVFCCFNLHSYSDAPWYPAIYLLLSGYDPSFLRFRGKALNK